MHTEFVSRDLKADKPQTQTQIIADRKALKN